jgi:hypothetical protein
VHVLVDVIGFFLTALRTTGPSAPGVLKGRKGPEFGYLGVFDRTSEPKVVRPNPRTKATAVHGHVHDHVNVHVDVHVLVDVIGFFLTTLRTTGPSAPASFVKRRR